VDVPACLGQDCSVSENHLQAYPDSEDRGAVHDDVADVAAEDEHDPDWDPWEALGPRSDSRAPIESIVFASPPALPGVQVMTVRDSCRLIRYYHETYSICSLLQLGCRGPEWVYRGRTHEAVDGDIMLMEPGELHVTKKVEMAKHYAVVMIAPEAMRAFSADIGRDADPHLTRAWVRDADLCRGFAALHAALQRQSSALEQQSRLAECVRALLERHSDSARPARAGAAHRSVARAHDYLREHYRDDVSLDELARAAGVSRCHLCRLFSVAMGLPPHAYQLQLRLARARELLAHGTPPARVAAEVGFCDQSHMGRCLKAAIGVTPSQYTRMVGAGARRHGTSPSGHREQLA